MQATPDLGDVVVPLLVTGVVQILVAAGGWYTSHHKDETTLRSAEAIALQDTQNKIRDELRADLERERKWRQELALEVEQLRNANERLRLDNERLELARAELQRRLDVLERREGVS